MCVARGRHLAGRQLGGWRLLWEAWACCRRRQVLREGLRQVGAVTARVGLAPTAGYVAYLQPLLVGGVVYGSGVAAEASQQYRQEEQLEAAESACEGLVPAANACRTQLCMLKAV